VRLGEGEGDEGDTLKSLLSLCPQEEGLTSALLDGMRIACVGVRAGDDEGDEGGEWISNEEERLNGVENMLYGDSGGLMLL